MKQINDILIKGLLSNWWFDVILIIGIIDIIYEIIKRFRKK